MAGHRQVSDKPQSNSSSVANGRSPLFHETAKLKDGLSLLQETQNGDEQDQKVIGPSAVQTARKGSEETLRVMIRGRADRLKFLPVDLFADPAWDMLLDLYLADILSKRVSVSSLCGASNVPATTALRWISALDYDGLVQRAPDPWDKRRYFISLSESGLKRMDDYFQCLAMDVTTRAH